MDRKKELQQKYNTNQSFKEEMIKAEQYYNALSSRNFYSNIQPNTQHFIDKYEEENANNCDVYFVYAAFQYQRAHSKDQLVQQFVKKIQKPTKQYILVYFNSEQYSDGFGKLRSVLQLMPFQYLYYLSKIVLMQPTFSQKASIFFTFGAIPKFINQHLQYAQSIQQLCSITKFNEQQVVLFLPTIVTEPFLQQIKHNHKSSKSDFCTPPFLFMRGKQQIKRLEIDQYEKSEEGLPKIFINLIYYFKQHPLSLKQPQIFKKRTDYVEQDQLYEILSNRHYQCLQKISNPYLVANLIKKFISSLLTPLIPENIFKQILNEKNITAKYLSFKMKQLYKINQTKLLTLIQLTNFFINYVISQVQFNKMNASNISFCIAPCIMKSQQTNINQVTSTKKAINTYIIMLNNFNEVFGNQHYQNLLYNSMYLQRRQQSFNQIQSSLKMGNSQEMHSTVSEPIKTVNKISPRNSKKSDFEQSVDLDCQQLCNVKLGLHSRIKSPSKELPINSSTVKTDKQEKSKIYCHQESKILSNQESNRLSSQPSKNSAYQQQFLKNKISLNQQQILKNRASANQEDLIKSKIFLNQDMKKQEKTEIFKSKISTIPHQSMKNKMSPQQVMKSRMSTNQQQVLKSHLSLNLHQPQQQKKKEYLQIHISDKNKKKGILASTIGPSKSELRSKNMEIEEQQQRMNTL